MPDDYPLTPELAAIAVKAGVLEIHHEFDKFCTYSRAKAKRWKRWDLAWRNWCQTDWVKKIPGHRTPNTLDGRYDPTKDPKSPDFGAI